MEKHDQKQITMVKFDYRFPVVWIQYYDCLEPVPRPTASWNSSSNRGVFPSGSTFRDNNRNDENNSGGFGSRSGTSSFARNYDEMSSYIYD